MTDRCRIIIGDARTALGELPEKSVRCCVTSPPYWGLRDYGVAGQIGLEATPEAWVADLVRVFACVRRVLTDDGTLWVNCGDAYAANRGYQVPDSKHVDVGNSKGSRVPLGLKQKDLIGLPWMLAFALRADGWYLRSDIIWNKPNPMPESVTDRPTKALECVFLFSKSPRYYFDAEAIAEQIASDPGDYERRCERTIGRRGDEFAEASGDSHRGFKSKMPPIGGVKAVGTPRNDGARWNENNGRGFASGGNGNRTYSGNTPEWKDTRNARSVWSIPTQGYSGAHFATFPRELAARCIKAGSAVGDLVLDPFLGTGTTIGEALLLGRFGVGVELNPEYARLARKRIDETCPLLAHANGPSLGGPHG